MTRLPTQPDVIVVGAGTAGLSAAHTMRQRGLEVVVVEAASRAGGRCFTDTTLFETPFDVGGSWLHSAPINPLARLAEETGTVLHKAGWDWTWVVEGDRRLTGAETQDYGRYHRDMWTAVEKAGDGPEDMTPAAALPASRWTDTAGHWIAQMQGADCDVTSARDAARYDAARGDWLVEGGLGAFVARLFADVPVRLNCPVREIDTTGPRVRAVTSGGTIEADQLVLTVSTGVLRAEAIRFTPALPAAKLAALENLPNGLLNKIGLEFDPDWQEAHQGQMADYRPSPEEFCTLLFGFFDSPLAVGFVAGRFADQLEAEGAGAATAFCLQALRDLFGNDVTKHVRRNSETAWRSNANALGSYSYARPGGADARSVLAQPVDDRLFFAGEATMPNTYATVHGAYLSGIAAADKVIAARDR